jgi:hypothetical protein
MSCPSATGAAEVAIALSHDANNRAVATSTVQANGSPGFPRRRPSSDGPGASERKRIVQNSLRRIGSDACLRNRREIGLIHKEYVACGVGCVQSALHLSAIGSRNDQHRRCCRGVMPIGRGGRRHHCTYRNLPSGREREPNEHRQIQAKTLLISVSFADAPYRAS